MTPRLSRAALIASVEALAAERENGRELIEAALADVESFRAANAMLKAQVVSREELILKHATEIARLKSELAALKSFPPPTFESHENLKREFVAMRERAEKAEAERKKGRIIRNSAWSKGDYLSVSASSGLLARMRENGSMAYVVEANTNGWEEADAP